MPLLSLPIIGANEVINLPIATPVTYPKPKGTEYPLREGVTEFTELMLDEVFHI